MRRTRASRSKTGTDYHWLRSRMRREAEARKWFSLSVSPAWARARFMASVISSGEWRAKYSFRASLKRRLRERLVRLARRSALSKMSLGMDTAVFTPGA